jgi:predicted flavoprotein YhiN
MNLGTIGMKLNLRDSVGQTEEDGRMFPVTDSSTTIVDCLMNETHRLGGLLSFLQSIFFLFHGEKCP